MLKNYAKGTDLVRKKKSKNDKEKREKFERF